MALNAHPLRRLVLWTSLLAVVPLAARAATAEDARRAYDAGHFTDAMGIWAQLSTEGNAEAEYGLGLLYDLGNGTPESPRNAFAWYRLAAEGGVPAAAFNVGAMYAAGRGVTQSWRDAALWYAQAAARGNNRARFDLALLYQQGDGVPRNPSAAGAWFQLAANGGIAAAKDRLKALDRAPAEDSGKPLAAATPVWPVPEQPVDLVDQTAVLVWVAPPEPERVRFELVVRDLDSTTSATVVATTLDTTATLVRLTTDARHYAWKVDTVASDGSRATGRWTALTVAVTPSREVAIAPLMTPLAPRHP